MGDQRFHLLDVSATAESAPQRAEEVRLWLRSRGWTEPCEGLVDWRKPVDQQGAVIAADAAGPRLVATSGQTYEAEEWPITVIDRWAIYDSGDALEGFRCTACGDVSGDVDDPAFDLIDTWHKTRRAPGHTCDSCGWSAPLSSWDVRAAAACSHVAISGDLVDAEEIVTQEITAELGGEWIWVYEHI